MNGERSSQEGEAEPTSGPGSLGLRMEADDALVAHICERLRERSGNGGKLIGCLTGRETPEELARSVRSLLRERQGNEAGDDTIPTLVGRSPALQEVKEQIRAAAHSTLPVLIHGPSGTGKEVVARAIHASSNRSHRPFIPVNCGALPEDLAESELFGHVRGAYTGAAEGTAGLFRAAAQGSILLDEVAEMPPRIQVKLLRVLQEHAVRSVGGTSEEPVDTRVLAATNRPLSECLTTGHMREDLYYRLAVLTIEIPPLAARPEDVEPLVAHTLARLRRSLGVRPETVTRSALARLQDHSWPGNVRELENVLEASVALARDRRTLRLEDLPTWIAEPRGARPIWPGHLPVPGNLEEAPPDGLKEGEAFLILRALRHAEGNKARAARLLKISRPLLYKRMKKLGLPL